MIPMMWTFNVPYPAAGSHTVKLRVQMGQAGTFYSNMSSLTFGSLILLEVNI